MDAGVSIKTRPECEWGFFGVRPKAMHINEVFLPLQYSLPTRINHKKVT